MTDSFAQAMVFFLVVLFGLGLTFPVVAYYKEKPKLKKLGYLALVGVAGVVDWLVRYGLAQTGVEVTFQFLVAAIVIVWLIINELLSILENVAAIGGPVPAFLQKLLGRLKNAVEKKAEDENADH